MSKPPGFSRLLMLLGAISLLTPGRRPLLLCGLALSVIGSAGCAPCGSVLTALGIGCLGIAYVMLRESIPARRSAVTGPK